MQKIIVKLIFIISIGTTRGKFKLAARVILTLVSIDRVVLGGELAREITVTAVLIWVDPEQMASGWSGGWDEGLDEEEDEQQAGRVSKGGGWCTLLEHNILL